MAYTKESAVFQRTQLGAESTPGTSVPGNRRMPSMQISIAEAAAVKMYRTQGAKVDGVAVLNKEWTTFKYDGNGTYNELPYILASVLTNVGMGPSGSAWTFQPSAFSADVPQTYTIEHGSDTYATKLVNGLFHDCTIAATRDEFKVSGSGIGKLLTTGISMTANPTLLPNAPVAANQISVFYDTSFGSIGTTQLKAVYSWELAISNRWGPNWVLDNTLPSWKDFVELVPTITLKMKMMRNADNDIILTRMRANEVGYLAFGTVGPTGYSTFINLPVAGESVSEPSDLAGVYTLEWSFKPILDSAFMTAKNGAFLEAIIVNTVAGL